jgi:hypothetical protein
MAKENGQFDENTDLKVSEEFKADLGNMFRPQSSISPEVDRAILDRAGRKLIRPRRRHSIIRRIGIVAATAAVIILAFSLDLSRQPRQGTPVTYFAEAKSADIDHSGRVDILDAFKLARQIESANNSESILSLRKQGFDMNGDGLVNRDDVDIVAMAAVSLPLHKQGPG